MKKNILKGQKGFAASDALIAVLIITLFSGLIATISYNIYISNASIKRMSKANGYIVDVFEYVDKSYYDDVTEENILQYFNEKYDNSEVKMKKYDSEEEINTPFKAEIKIEKYTDREENRDKLDLVKEITITINYKLGNKPQSIPMTHTKQRENLSTPNVPNFQAIELQDGENVYPIKKINNTWKICDRNDKSWYDYQDGKWALIIKTDRELSLDEQININDLSDNEAIYAWIPRYAYDSINNRLEFLFSNSNSYITQNEYGYSTLEDIDGDYIVSSEFSYNGKQLVGSWVNDKTVEIYINLHSVYPMQEL